MPEGLWGSVGLVSREFYAEKVERLGFFTVNYIERLKGSVGLVSREFYAEKVERLRIYIVWRILNSEIQKLRNSEFTLNRTLFV